VIKLDLFKVVLANYWLFLPKTYKFSYRHVPSQSNAFKILFFLGTIAAWSQLEENVIRANILASLKEIQTPPTTVRSLVAPRPHQRDTRTGIVAYYST